MHLRLWLCVLALTVVSCSPKTDTSGTYAHELTEELQHLKERRQLMGLSVALIRDGQLVYAKGLGTANLRLEIPLVESTKFRIASISKLITTIALMQLVDGGSVSLDEDVSVNLGWELVNPHMEGQAITLRYLLSHQSGIRDGEGYGNFLRDMHDSQLHIRDLFTEDGAYYSPDMFAREAPGASFSYSNAAWGLVASVIENVSGLSFDAYCRQNIFQPLGLNASYRVTDIGERDLAAL